MSLETGEEPWLWRPISGFRLRWAVKTDRDVRRLRGHLSRSLTKHFNSIFACDTCPASNFIRSVANNKPYYLTCAVREDFDVLRTQKALTDSTLGLGISVFHNPHERWPRNLAYNVPLRWLHRSSGIGKQLQTTISPLQKTIFGFQTQL